MKILMISYYYPPHSAIGATRGYLVSTHLAQRGHDLRVLAAKPLPGGTDTSKFPDWAAPAEGRVRVTRTGRAERWMGRLRDGLFRMAGTTATSGGHDYQAQVTAASRRTRDAGPLGQLAARALQTLRSDLVPERELSWNPEALTVALQMIRDDRPDALYVCGRPFVSFYVGAALKAITGIPLLLDLRDPWSLLEHHDPLTHRLLYAQERPLFLAADRILVNTHTALERYKNLYPPAITDKMSAAPNAMSAWPPEAPLPGDPQNPEPLILVHGGNLYRRSITPLLQAAQRLAIEQGLGPAQLQLRQVGRIDVDTFDPELVQALGAQMQIHPFLPYEQYQEHVHEATALIVLLGPDHHLRIPAKFYECLATGKAILFLGPRDHEVVDVLERQTGVGVGADAGDPEDIYRALLRLQRDVLPRLRQRAGSRDALRPFHITARAEQIEATLAAMIAAP
jgi:hypothetical protein